MDVVVKITNWEKYNPRRDIKRPTWFALNNELVEDDDFFDFDHGEFKAWIYILSKASKKQSSEVSVSFSAAQRKSNISALEFKSAIEKLERLKMVTVIRTEYERARDEHVTLHNITRHNNTLHNTTLHNTTKQGTSERGRDVAVRKANVGKEAVAAYCEAWNRRYKTNPTVQPKDAKQLKSCAESVGLARVKELIEAYLRMNESWFLTKRHDIQTFLSNLNAVTQFCDTGQSLKRSDIAAIEVAESNLQTLQKLREGKI